MKSWIRCSFLIIVATFGIPATGQELPSQLKETRDMVWPLAKAVIEEFEIEIKRIADKETDPDSEKFARITEISPKTKMIFVEQVANRYQEIMDAGGPDIREAAKKYVQGPMIREFRPAFIAAYPEWIERSGGVLAGLGQADFASIAPFLSTMNNLFGVHLYGHSDITGEAVEALKTDSSAPMTISSDAKTLLMMATQLTDVYGWDHDEYAYHAHSAHYECCSPEARKAGIVEGQAQFKELFQHHLSMAIIVTDTLDSAFHIGACLHMAQDLVYHRGMTLIQHAGLSYVLKNDPDKPHGSNDYPSEPMTPGSLAAERYQEAVDVSKRLLRIYFSKMDPTVRGLLLSWKMGDSPNFSAAGVNVYGHQVDESELLWQMLGYFASQWVYRFGRRDQDVDLSDDPDRGLVRWEVASILNQLLSEYE